MPDYSTKKKIISIINELKSEIKTQFTNPQNDYQQLQQNTQGKNYQSLTSLMAITQNNQQLIKQISN